MAAARNAASNRRNATPRSRRTVLTSGVRTDGAYPCLPEAESDPDPGWLTTRSELSTLLRTWRMRRAPADFPDFPELLQRPRRSSYLTVEDAAALCGVSPAWYRSFESGEPNGYSIAFLERVTTMLALDAAERETMFLLATGHAPIPQASASIHHISPGIRVTLDAQIWPAYVLDHAGAILARNHSSVAWFPSQSTEYNLATWLFGNPAAREQFAEWAVVARSSLAHLRVQYARTPQCPRLRETLKVVLDGSSDARVMWKVKPQVSFGEDRHVRRVQLPGAPAVTDVETVASTLDSRFGLRLFTLVPVGGHLPQPSWPGAAANRAS